MRRLLLPLLGLAVLAPPAHAATVTHKDVAYAVEYSGIGKYDKLDQHDMGTEYWGEEAVSLDFMFSGEIRDGIVFRDGHPFDKSGDTLGTDTVSGKISYRGSGGDGMTCPVDDNVFATGWMRLMEDPDEVVPLDGETHVWVRPFERYDISFDCGGSHPGVDLAEIGEMGENGEIPAGKHTFDTPFSLPREVFGMGYIEQIIPEQVVTGERCPSRTYDTVECKLTWSGKVIFRKLWENTVTSENGEVLPPSTHKGDAPMDIPPLVPPAPKPPAPKPPVSEDDDFLVPLVQPDSAKLDASGKTATVTVTCGGGCAGTASIVAGSGGGARAAASKPLASAKFRVPAGKKATKVRVKLGAKARRKLRRARSAKLRLAFTKPTKRTQTLKLRLPGR